MSFSGFDWTKIDFGNPIEVHHCGRISINGLRTQFDMAACSPLEETMWLLGLYQAEGLKTYGATQFVLSNKSRVVLGRAIRVLEQIGITKDRMVLNIKHQRVSESEALAYYGPLGVTSTIRRANDERAGDFGANLTLRDSSGFGCGFRAALTTINDLQAPSSRWAFLDGFLVGDGSITLCRTGALLRARCGRAIEAELIRSLMADQFGDIRQAVQIGGSFEVGRGVTPFHAVDLIDRGAFIGTSSRIRLFHLAHRLHKLSTVGANRRWGNVDANGQPTQKVLEARERLAKHADEWAFIQTRWPTEREAIMRRKGVLYEYPPIS